MINYERQFKDSHERILGGRTSQGNEFFDAFYDRFIASSPEVAQKFQNIDMTHQKTMLRHSLSYLLNLSSTKTIPDHFVEIARSHSRQNTDIAPHLYDLWLGCLIETVSEFDPDFCDDVELAWRMMCAHVIALMTFMYDRP